MTDLVVSIRAIDVTRDTAPTLNVVWQVRFPGRLVKLSFLLGRNWFVHKSRKSVE
jgi:hypothetical protein